MKKLGILSFMGIFALASLALSGHDRTYALDFDSIAYDVKSQSEFSAIIKKIEIEEWDTRNGKTAGVYLTVECSDKVYLVPLGPEWYVRNIADLKLEQRLLITGVARKTGGPPIILPKSITVGTMDVFLRNYDGRPMWSLSDDVIDNIKIPQKSAPHAGQGGGHSGH